MEVLYRALTWVMTLCYGLCRNYGLAILLFTLLSKIVLLPISVWLQKNSIKMVKMQPEINRLKVAHFGVPDAIAEGQSAIFKREKYHPLASILPLAIQVLLLMGLMTSAGWDFYRNEGWHYQLFDARRYPLVSDADLPRPMM